jgi:glycosyl hydrolase family 26
VKFTFGVPAMRTLLCKVAWPIVAVFLVSLLLGPASAALWQASSEQASNASSILEPASGALLGQFYGAGTMAQTAAKLGRIPTVHLTYYPWDADWNGSVTKADLAAGRIPLVNWEPHHIDFAKIIDGSLDATIVARARGAKALGQKFFLDFAAEMNGDEAWSGNNSTLYVGAYRHIHDIFVASGATNVVWVWCPNVTDTEGANRTTMDYYPGDSYVDWTGVDGYNWGTKNGGWQSFQQVFKDIYPLLAAKKKPIMIGEMSSAEAGGDKAKWIDQIIPTLRTNFPLIKCVVWFDINKEADWRISSSPASEASFIRMAKDPYFNP